MNILQRYVLKEHVGPLLFALATLTSLLLLNQIAKQFGNLVGKGLEWSVIGEFFMLSVPFIIAMTLPMAVLVATLYAFSRLASENEITALKASGVGHFRILSPVLWGALVISFLMIWFNDQVLPAANHRLSTLQTDIGRTKPTFALREQVINEVSPGRLYLRAGDIDERSNGLREVTIYDLSDPQRRRTIHADSGKMQLAANRMDLELTLFDGFSQEIPRDNTTELQRLYFRTDLVKVRGVATGFSRTADKGYKSDREMTICEMQSEVHRAANDLSAANMDLATTMGIATYYLATGETRPIEPASPNVRLWSLARVYCGYVMPLFRTKEVQAAVAPQPDDTFVAPLQAARQSSAAGTDSASRIQLPEAVQRALPPTFRGPRGTQQPVTSAPVLTGTQSAMSRLATADPFLIAQGQLEATSGRIRNARMDLNQYQVEIEKKFALAAACLVFVLLGAPMALRFPRGGVGLVIGASLAVFGLYYVGLIAGETLADKLIVSPFVAMWMANVVFTIAGFVLLYMLRRSGSTTRGGDFGEMWDALRRRLSRRSRHPTPTLAERGSVAS
ncbi:MAG TPA: LptF/LptG family permease [Gemmatimonadaceae bacterium]|nr:LptF/LptG family permease [Gemmatimonadaceae bacterium]